jgi:hypothetical protein
MATTPEGRIKARLTKLLKQLNVWYFFPASGPMGRSGIPDVICIVDGLFIGIECKSDPSKKPTALQVRVGEEITQAGGAWFLIRSNEDIKQLGELIMSGDIKKRISYVTSKDKLTARFGGAGIDLSVPESLKDILAVHGLRAYIQQHTINTESDDRLESVEQAYENLLVQGEAAFERKSPVGRKVQFKKADKIMAVAMLKGVTVTAAKAALMALEPEKQAKILNSDAVMNKLRDMQEQVDLEV